MSICWRCGNDHDKSSSEWDLLGHLCAYRADRPDEWTMDDFMRLAKKERDHLQSASAEVARLQGYLEQILAHPRDVMYGAEFWINLAREALKETTT